MGNGVLGAGTVRQDEDGVAEGRAILFRQGDAAMLDDSVDLWSS